DLVKEIIDFPYISIEPLSPMLAFVGTNYLQGIGKLNDRIIFLINMDKLLAGEIESKLNYSDR
ncbi:MAG: chemotaxis protein CheW, partial [Candidatus Desantisbacteria bacterium]